MIFVTSGSAPVQLAHTDREGDRPNTLVTAALPALQEDYGVLKFFPAVGVSTPARGSPSVSMRRAPILHLSVKKWCIWPRSLTRWG